MAETTAPGGLDVRVVGDALWGDLEHLFAGKGGPGSCWCMLWRATPGEATRTDAPSLKWALRRRVDAGVPVGLLGYLDGEPVAWCSVAPRPTYRRLGGADYDGVTDDEIWSVVCFFVHRRARGTGVSRTLLGHAVEYAARSGARVVEAYPVDPDSPSYRFMGFVPVFAAAGFEEVGRAGKRRHVMALRVRA